ncbi:MAG: cytochrome B [Citromicrobium sp.]|nr:cytochrome B [Citromicrobium sp.]MBT48320.1 cytochrome B [Citromicrobium sp.]|tara:strand:- start:332 stop:973 length:642 start_codon:yes stop_codon:yes gene_type:complete
MLRGLYNWTVEKAAHPHAQWWLALFAFVESSFFPIPPHPLLGLMCLAEPKKAIRFALIATVASVVGGMFGYAIGALLYDSIGVWLITKLGYADIFPWAACTVNANGGWAVFTTASTPIPYKLMTITAGFVHMNFATFLIASIAGRGLIFMTVGVLFRLFGAPIKIFIDKYLVPLTTLFVVLVVGGFLLITQLGHHDEASAANDPCANATLENF